MRSAGLMGDAAVYMTILYCLAFAPFLLPAANDVGALTATSYEVMRVLVITASLARLGGSGHVVLGSFQWSKVGETRGFRRGAERPVGGADGCAGTGGRAPWGCARRLQSLRPEAQRVPERHRLEVPVGGGGIGRKYNLFCKIIVNLVRIPDD